MVVLFGIGVAWQISMRSTFTELFSYKGVNKAYLKFKKDKMKHEELKTDEDIEIFDREDSKFLKKFDWLFVNYSLSTDRLNVNYTAAVESGQAFLAKPTAALRLLCQAHTGKVEPLVGADLVVARYHVTVAHVIAKAKGRLSTVLWHGFLNLLSLLRILKWHSTFLASGLSGLVDRTKCSQQLGIQLIWDWLNQGASQIGLGFKSTWLKGFFTFDLAYVLEWAENLYFCLRWFQSSIQQMQVSCALSQSSTVGVSASHGSCPWPCR